MKAWLINKTIGNYRVTSQLGEGGMGAVYLAQHPVIGRKVAIKVLHAVLARDPDIVARFFNEARAIHMIGHENIVEILDFGQTEDGQPYFIMEYLTGESLAAVIARGLVPLDRVKTIADQTCRAMSAVHNKGILHRDLKPHNIQLVTDKDGAIKVKLLDFGVAKILSSEDGGLSVKTRTGSLMGTPIYMSPEQCKGAGRIDHRSDIYSLGVIFFEMLAGRLPFIAEGVGEMFAKHMLETPPELSELSPATPTAMAEAVMRSLAKEPDSRFDSMEAFRLALFGQGNADRVRPRPSSTPVPWSTSQSRARRLRAVETDESKARAKAIRDDQPRSPLGSALRPADRNPEDAYAQASSDVQARYAGNQKAILDALPTEMRGAHHLIGRFLDALFKKVEPLDAHGMVRLDDARFEHARQYQFLAMFIAETGETGAQAPLGRLATGVFVDRGADLRKQVGQLQDGLQAIVLVIARAGDLGAGVRELIVEYRRKHNAIIVPMYLGEIARWDDAKDLTRLFNSRLKNYGTVPDPYATQGLSSDPSQIIGMNEEVTNVVYQIREAGGVINITGQPGCGKSALVHLAEYSSANSRFVYVSAADASHRDPLLFAAEVEEAVTGGNRALLRPGGKFFAALDEYLKGQSKATVQPSIIRTVFNTMSSQSFKELGDQRSLVLVIEDADWLIELLGASQGQASQAQAREFWTALGEASRGGRITVLVTSVRGFDLSERVVSGWANHVKPLSIPVRPLDVESLENLVVTLGRSVSLKFSQRAIAQIWEVTGGNVFVTRALCSGIVRAARRGKDHSVVAPHDVSIAEIRAAGQELIASPSLGKAFVKWCGPAEREILQFVASKHPATPRAIRRALGEPSDPDVLGAGIDALQAKHLVAFEKRRYRITVPLLEKWILLHMDPKPERTSRVRYKWIRAVSSGAAMTAVLGVIYFGWIHPKRRVDQASFGSCTVGADYPELAGPEERIAVILFRDCSAPPYPVLSVLAPRLPADKIQQDAMSETAPLGSARASIELLPIAGEAYRFELLADKGSVLRFEVKKDVIATFRAGVSRFLEITALLPALFGVLVAFHRQIFAKLKSLVIPENAKPDPIP